jgi:hypothetical protein
MGRGVRAGGEYISLAVAARKHTRTKQAAEKATFAYRSLTVAARKMNFAAPTSAVAGRFTERAPFCRAS